MDDQKTVLCPRSDPSKASIVINMDDLEAFEARLKDVSGVNPETAPELLSYFNEKYLQFSRMIFVLEEELIDARSITKREKSDAFIFRAPKKIKEHGLGSARFPYGTDKQREAVADADEQYLEAWKREQTIRQWANYIGDIRSRADHGYQSVKKIMTGWIQTGAGDKTPRPPSSNDDAPNYGFGASRF